MPTSKTITDPDELFLHTLIQRIDIAQSSVQLMTFLFGVEPGQTGV